MNETMQTLLLAAVAAIVGGLTVLMFGGLVGNQSDDGFGGTRFPNGLSADGTSPSAGEVRGTTLTTTGAATVGGALTVSGAVTGLATTETITAADTITAAQSGTIFLTGTGTTSVLPAVSNSGVKLRFNVSSSTIADTNFIVDSAEGDNIFGELIVNDAPVVCQLEDQINVVNSAESPSDWFELLSDGTNWYIIGSNGDAAGSITCTDPS
jgi:hypothetical protein